MELSLSNSLLAGDPRLVDHIVGEVKSQGIFDQFRKECIADVDTKPAYQNLRTRVEASVNTFLGKQPWKPDLNKNQLRETLRKHIHDAPYLDAGVERIVDQVVNPKVYSVFMPQVEDVVYKFLGLERPKTKEKNGSCGLKDLLPKDLDPVSPESDRNSLKDVSLESVDAMDDLCIAKDETPFNKQNLMQERSDANKNVLLENGQLSSEDKTVDESYKSLNKNSSNNNLNTSTKSDDKTEDDEEDSPTFEPIDIMNLNESNISNDSHLSGISELTSHRSRSPDFSNEFSRDNFDYSNQDSQLSKVSSDSHLSIVTDFGSSNHALSLNANDTLKDDRFKEKAESKSVKDNFKAIREFESSKNKNIKHTFELHKCNKDNASDVKDSKDLKESKRREEAKNSLSSRENSSDATDSARDKYDRKNHKDKNKDDSSKSKLTKEKTHFRDSKHYKDKDTDKKKQSSHSSAKYDKHGKHKVKDKTESVSKDQIRETTERNKDTTDYAKDNFTKSKDEKTKDIDKKDNFSKEVKDLKDLYKEKIRELREKKELTEKEKYNKDNRDLKSNKESKDRKEFTKDKKSYKKDHKSSPSKSNSASQDEQKYNKIIEKTSDVKDKKNDSRGDKGKRDEKHVSKDNKSKSVGTSEVTDKQDSKKISKSEKGEKYDKTEMKKDIKSNKEGINYKKDVKNHMQNKSTDRSSKSDKKDTRNDPHVKDKKRKEDKKSKSKDDHSSLRKNSNDRRSTDRDGANGSGSKSMQSNNSSSNNTSNKSNSSTLTKETGHINNSSGETSDSIETQVSELNLPVNPKQAGEAYITETLNQQTYSACDTNDSTEIHFKSVESGSNDANLPLKKRPLLEEERLTLSEVKVKKPKFAKNIHEAKKLRKLRKQIEKQKLKENESVEKKLDQKVTTHSNASHDNLESVPDEERVQIIEIPDEEYEEPYPERQTNLTLEEQSIIMLQGEACTNELLQKQLHLKSKLSGVDLFEEQSLNKAIFDEELKQETNTVNNMELHNFSVPKTQQKEHCTQVTESLENEKICNIKDTDTVQPEGTKIAIENYLIENTKCRDTKSLSDEAACTHKLKEAKESTERENTEVQCTAKDTDATCNAEQTNTINNVLQSSKDCIGESSSAIVAHTKDERQRSITTETLSKAGEEHEDCKYFNVDAEKSEKFSHFLESFELDETSTLEDIIESLGGQVVFSTSKEMAPPLPKRKHSSSPLTDIFLSNSNNNNDGHTKTEILANDNSSNNVKKRKVIAAKQQRFPGSICVPQSLLNGENFVMPLSPDSDVSATSEKMPSSNSVKEEKSRHRGGRHRSSQRYSSDDLYKPRPLFSSSSSRSRRSNQA